MMAPYVVFVPAECPGLVPGGACVQVGVSHVSLDPALDHVLKGQNQKSHMSCC